MTKPLPVLEKSRVVFLVASFPSFIDSMVPTDFLLEVYHKGRSHNLKRYGL